MWILLFKLEFMGFIYTVNEETTLCDEFHFGNFKVFCKMRDFLIINVKVLLKTSLSTMQNTE